MNDRAYTAVNDRVQTLLSVCSRLAHIDGVQNQGIEYLIDYVLTPWWRFKQRKKLKKLLMEYKKNE